MSCAEHDPHFHPTGHPLLPTAPGHATQAAAIGRSRAGGTQLGRGSLQVGTTTRQPRAASGGDNSSWNDTVRTLDAQAALRCAPAAAQKVIAAT